jgi:AraC-like DNA-binding protein
MSGVGPPSSPDRSEMIGVYFRAAQVSRFLHVPATELTDLVVPVEDVCGRETWGLAEKLAEAGHAARLELLESMLLQRFAPWKPPSSAIDVPRLASWVSRRAGRVNVERMADAAGVSRQHLRKVFREHAGVTPKLYCRLVRYQHVLGFAGSAGKVDWAQAAVELGYSDQSHMISECRRFTSLTPQEIVSGNWFHPFIERAKAARRRGNA